MGRKKITVVGGGNVGATAAQRLADKELGDVEFLLHFRKEDRLDKQLQLERAEDEQEAAQQVQQPAAAVQEPGEQIKGIRIEKSDMDKVGYGNKRPGQAPHFIPVMGI